MKIKIEDMLPEDDGRVRMYYTVDGGELTALILERNDLVSIQTIENAVKDALKGKAYIGQSFDI